MVVFVCFVIGVSRLTLFPFVRALLPLTSDRIVKVCSWLVGLFSLREIRSSVCDLFVVFVCLLAFVLGFVFFGVLFGWLLLYKVLLGCPVWLGVLFGLRLVRVVQGCTVLPSGVVPSGFAFFPLNKTFEFFSVPIIFTYCFASNKVH